MLKASKAQVDELVLALTATLVQELRASVDASIEDVGRKFNAFAVQVKSSQGEMRTQLEEATREMKAGVQRADTRMLKESKLKEWDSESRTLAASMEILQTTVGKLDKRAVAAESVARAAKQAAEVATKTANKAAPLAGAENRVETHVKAAAKFVGDAAALSALIQEKIDNVSAEASATLDAEIRKARQSVQQGVELARSLARETAEKIVRMEKNVAYVLKECEDNKNRMEAIHDGIRLATAASNK